MSSRASFAPGEESATAQGKRRFGQSMTLSVWSTVVGAPAVAVPTGTDRGRPLGVQLVGPAYREDACLDAAQLLESAYRAPTPVDPR